jgi:hypothetical protein
VCNLYSMTKNVDAIRRLFGALNSRVGDNFHCGGANVSFSGVYQKRPKR